MTSTPGPPADPVLAALQRTAQTLAAWTSGAGVEEPTSEHWDTLVEMLANLVLVCVERAERQRSIEQN